MTRTHIPSDETGVASAVLRELRVDAGGKTDRGLVREVNEDQFLTVRLGKAATVLASSVPGLEANGEVRGRPESWLLAVADGIGSMTGSQRASAVTLEVVLRYVLQGMPSFYRIDHEDPARLQAALAEAVRRSRRELVRNTPGGTTLTLAYVLWPRLYLAHVGDSRCYLLRRGRLTQLTTDHTLAQKLVDQGVLSPEQAERSEYRHVLWNAITSEREERGAKAPPPELQRHRLLFDDVLLLCSDGLTRHVSDEEIAEILDEESSAQAISERLVAAANANGGSDNITVSVARFGVSEPNEV